MDIRDKAKDAVLKKLKEKMSSAMVEGEEMPEDMAPEAETEEAPMEAEMETEEAPMEAEMEMEESMETEMPYEELPDGTFRLETTDPEIIEKVKMALMEGSDEEGEY